jgi:CheY-like chemotaxis protein
VPTDRGCDSIEGCDAFVTYEIRIKDSGCGISPENIGKLFMNFSRLAEH